MPRLPIIAIALLIAAAPPARCEDDGSSRADAERMLQTYLAIWSDDAQVSPETVGRFYAPAVSYYGHELTRAQVLADKRAFIRSYPRRSWREVPGTFAGDCNGDRSRCRVTAVIVWHRTDRLGTTSEGRSRIAFDFVPVEGGRKIARESAWTL